jgi:hypothetical protein
MTTIRKLIIAFWIFIVVMLLWQFHTYNQGLAQDAVTHPQQEHFYFLPSNAAPVAPAQVHHDGAFVEQSNYSTENNVPASGSFTCHVTLKNVGNAKAVGIQISVRPYRGITTGNQDAGNSPLVILNDNNPLAQMGQWLSFPDLAPGETSTQDVVFLGRSGVLPGMNPNPEIIFETAKTPAANASASTR